MSYPALNKEQRNAAYLRRMQEGDYPLASLAEETIQQAARFLIVCEGENTEPRYFEAFPVPSNAVVIEGGCGSKTALVKRAKELAAEEDYAGREAWCVFDMDVKPDEARTQPEDFNRAIEMAEAAGMHVAWSNDAFELWFLLHYHQVTSALTRQEIYKILKKEWGLQSFSREAKADAFCKGAYTRHGGTKSRGQTLAIERARALHESYGDRKDYAAQCPCTTVYALVERLNANLRP